MATLKSLIRIIINMGSPKQLPQINLSKSKLNPTSLRQLNANIHDIKDFSRNVLPPKVKERLWDRERNASIKAERAQAKLLSNNPQTDHHPQGTIKFTIELLKFIKGDKKEDNKSIPFYPAGYDEYPDRIIYNKGDVFDKSRTKVYFWATFESLNETVSPTWNSKIYFGRTEGVHHLESTERTLTTSFVLQANNEKEQENIIRKLNFLTQCTYPGKIIVDGNSNLMTRQPPMLKINIGDLYKEQFAIITSLTNDSFSEVPWSNDINELPVFIKIDLTFILLHELQPTFETTFHTFTNRTI